MSGRDPEPISAFFPSIDRKLIRDLDRHLRNAAPAHPHHAAEDQPEEPPHKAQTQNQDPSKAPDLPVAARPSTIEVLEAVQHAASSMMAMSQRIEELEAKQLEMENVNNQLRTKLGDLLQLQHAAEIRARGETERAERAEEIAAQHLSRTQELENDLEAALSDLTRIAEAITGSLGAHHR